MTVLVTGGTGFLGRRLVERLTADGHPLRLLVRPSSSRARFPDGVELVEGDVTHRASLERAATGCEAVVHAAALVKILAPAAEYERVNVAGLHHLLAAAAGCGVRRIVYVSSFIALGPTEAAPGGMLDERAPAVERRFINDYERTKTRADASARRAIETGAPLAVVYPGILYGPGELTEGNLVVRHLLDLAHGRLPALLGRPERRWSYAHVDDVAAGVVAALDRFRPGARYVLGGDNVTLGDFYARVAEVAGIRVPARRLPDPVARLLGRAMKAWAQLAGGTPRLTPDLVEIYRHDWAYDSTTAMGELDYRPRGLAQGLAETVAWLRKRPEWPRR